MRSDTKPTALLTFTGLFAAMITIMTIMRRRGILPAVRDMTITVTVYRKSIGYADI